MNRIGKRPGLIMRLVMRSLKKKRNESEHDIPRDYAEARVAQDRLSRKQPLPIGVKRTREDLGWWFEDKGSTRKKIVLYIHGGGFSVGSAESSYNFPVAVCRKGGFPVLSVEYRLAPEHPYPAALEDCVHACQTLLARGFHGKDIVLLGDSAGGNLVFATALYLRDHGIELPAALCGVSPVGAMDDTPPSRKERAERDPMIGKDFTEETEAIYVCGHDRKDPYLSPIYGDFTGVPPIWMCVGTEEVFYDDALLLAKAAQKSGVPVQLIVGEGMCHVYPVIPDRISSKTVQSLRNFIAAALEERQ